MTTWFIKQNDSDNRMVETDNQSNALSHTITDDELNALLSSYDADSGWNDSMIALHANHPQLGYGGKYNRNNRGHVMVAFLTSHPSIALNRSQLLIVYQVLFNTDDTPDVIQYVNKCDQKGLMRVIFPTGGHNTLYGFPIIAFDGSKVMKRTENLSSSKINESTAYIRDLGKHMMEDNLEKGHMNPNKPLYDDNVVMQPHCINAAYRDKYIFDKNGLPQVPNPSQVVNNPDYYTNGDKILLAALTKSFMQACENNGINLDDDNIKNSIRKDYGL